MIGFSLRSQAVSPITLFKNSERAETFPAGATIFSEGDDPGGLMYVVVAGEVDIFVRGQLIDTIGPGASLGEIGLVDKGPRSATAVAKRESRLEPIDAKRFQYLVQQTPHFALQVMTILAKRLRLEREQ
jgi:CRP/FNR family transcriptional regulator, cyclic AMP receptor protein